MNRLKNIIIINDWACRDGGAAAVALNTAVELSKKFNVSLFCAVGPIDNNVKKSKVHVHFLNKQDILHDTNRLRAIINGLWHKKSAVELERLLENFSKEDTIVHVHTWTKALSSSIFRSIAKSNLQLVITLHDYFCFCPNGGFYNYQKSEICNKKPLSLSCICTNCDVRSYPQKIWRLLRQKIQNHEIWNNHNLHFISISNFTDKICVPLIPSNAKVYKLYDPVELSLHKRVVIQNNTNYICMARLSPEKGVNLFCKAITDLGFNGIVMGDGEQLDDLKKKYPKINFVGWVNSCDKEKYFSQSKAFVFPSLWYETFGLTVAEAKSYGIPCIVPDNCAASEQVADGKTGYIFKTGDLDSLKAAIMKYEQTNLKQMQENLLNSFHPEDLSMETHLKKLIAIYNDILSNEK